MTRKRIHRSPPELRSRQASAAGPIAGYLLRHFGEQLHRPALIWVCVTAIGVLTTVLLWIYDLMTPKTEAAG